MKEIYHRISPEHLKDHLYDAAIENSLVVLDNLDKDIQVTDMERDRLLNNPIQYVSTMSLLLCLRGNIDVNIGLKKYHMTDNDALFLKSGVIAELTYMDDDTQFISVSLDEQFYYPIFRHMDFSALQRALITQPICHMEPWRMNECVRTYQLLKMRLQKHADELLQYEIIKGYLQALLFNIYSNYLTKDINESIGNENHKTRQKELFNKFIELVQRDYREERNLNYYADLLCVTPSYLSRVIFNESGHYASEHIDNFVMTEAKQLLRSRQYTILQISEMLNFTSQSLFGRYFKRQTGVSPKQYLEME